MDGDSERVVRVPFSEYVESVRMMRVFVVSGTVSKTRAMACNMYVNASDRRVWMAIHVQSAPLCYSFDHRDISQIGSLITIPFNSYGE